MLVPNNLYHVYNRGNNHQEIFLINKNYCYFLEKIKLHIYPLVDIICYCLMPNHFHFLFHIPEQFENKIFRDNLKICLSSYTRAINIQEKRSGSLFQQHTKFKCLTDNSKQIGYPLTCFNYIHQNPLASGLVSKMEAWKFSSFSEYIGKRDNSICKKNLALELLEIPKDNEEFYRMSCDMVNPEKIKNIF